jgi:hypothetical protein
MTVYDLMAITIADCPCCDAKIGEGCVNNSGKVSNCVHWQRKQAVQEWRKADHQGLYKKFRREIVERLELLKTPEYGMEGC